MNCHSLAYPDLRVYVFIYSGNDSRYDVREDIKNIFVSMSLDYHGGNFAYTHIGLRYSLSLVFQHDIMIFSFPKKRMEEKDSMKIF